MNPEPSPIKPEEIDRLIACFGERPNENTRSSLENDLLQQKGLFERSRERQASRKQNHEHERER